MSVSKKKWRLAIGACAVMVIAATAWAQQESRKMLEEWLSLSKKGREEYKAQMEKNISGLKDIFKKPE